MDDPWLEGFEESKVNPDKVAYADKAREKQRVKALEEEAAARAANPEDFKSDSRKEKEKRKREEAAAAAEKAGETSTHSLVHSLVYSLVHSLVHWSIHWFIYCFIYCFIYWITYWSISPLIGSFIGPLDHSFVHSYPTVKAASTRTFQAPHNHRLTVPYRAPGVYLSQAHNLLGFRV